MTTICTQLIEIAQNQGSKNIAANFPYFTKIYLTICHQIYNSITKIIGKR
ncbi:hypothetical protein [Cylindrospermum stagnale]|nr:hypothetical protein [Cylindrospermum stagnale]